MLNKSTYKSSRHAKIPVSLFDVIKADALAVSVRLLSTTGKLFASSTAKEMKLSFGLMLFINEYEFTAFPVYRSGRRDIFNIIFRLASMITASNGFSHFIIIGRHRKCVFYFKI